MLRTIMLAVALTVAAPATQAATENRYGVAVIIGNRGYGGDVPAVEYAHNDAEAMKRYVIEQLGYRPGNVIDLRDATQTQMLSVFGTDKDHRGKLFQFVRPGRSDVVVFYSGHGVPGLRSQKGYLLPVDANPQTVEINAYPIDQLYANLQKIEAKSVTVFLDACFSGGSPGGMLIKSASPVFVKTELPPATGRLTVISAAQGDQVASWDETAGHGLFTEYLLRGLYGEADKPDFGGNGDGAVAVSEVQGWLDEEMTYAARRHHNREQLASVQGDLDTVLISYPGAAYPERPLLAAPQDAPPAARAAEPKVASLTPPAATATDAAPAAAPATAAPVALEPVEQEMQAIRNANVRAEPTVNGTKTGFLPAGTIVHVSGKVVGDNWFQVERDGLKLGFVYGTLLGPPGSYVAEAPAPAAQRTASLSPAPAPQGVRGRAVYNVQPITYSGQRLMDMEDVVAQSLQGLPNAEVVRRHGQVARGETVIAASLVSLQVNEEQNPEAAGAAIASTLFGALGKAMTQNVAPGYLVVEATAVARADDPRTGQPTTEQGVGFLRADARQPRQQSIASAVRQAFQEAANRLAMRLGGATPPPLVTAMERRQYELQEKALSVQQHQPQQPAGSFFNR